jgi:hypothetical protein
MIKLYWGNYENGYNKVADCFDQTDLDKTMIEYLNKIKFKNYYFRGWVDEDGFTHCDYGSHINFFKYKEE